MERVAGTGQWEVGSLPTRSAGLVFFRYHGTGGGLLGRLSYHRNAGGWYLEEDQTDRDWDMSIGMGLQG